MPEENFQKRSRFQEDYSGNSNPGFSNSSPSVGMPWRLMIFSFVLFAFSIFIFLGLRFGYETYLDSQLESLNEEINQLTTKISEGEQQEFLGFYSQFRNLDKVLEGRMFSHNIFDFLESYTLPFISYSEAEYSASAREIRLNGVAQDMRYLVEQMNVFGEASEVSEVDLVSVDLFSGQVGFEIRLVFNSSYFNKPI
jgi:hypothetical protein